MAKSIVVLISGNGSNLQAIIDNFCTAESEYRLSAVFSNKQAAYGLQRAKDAGIDAHFVDPAAFDSRESFDNALMESINEYQPDLLVLAGYMRILSSEFVKHYQGKMLNVHPSLLPKYPGLHTHQRAIDAGDKEHGTSVHFVTEELDGGPVILQAKVPVFADDTADSLNQRIQSQEHRIYPLVIKWYLDGRLKMENNRAVLDGEILAEQGYASE